ncbi:hypothetical protein ASE12_08650 [Aeromicrobium sp. Root236]|uniref:peptidase inhibitor family I36 protein n=1 Tax=Aeromicrobium sp. Root236 TaxID=1736498 RepID=UPI0006F5358C|nr:peptidase inhibitor family I36 protein [Aeromicrobium sp. Root236]KRC64832.1 hypothetical protein ASE12_08650 [Aeromicrobium sp. Root236]
MSRRLGLAVTAALLPLAASLGPLASEAVALRSLSQCQSGYLCVWSGSGYTGTIQRFRATGTYRPITVDRVKSVYNHRAGRAFVHEGSGGGGVFACFSPGERVSETSGWVQRAGSVYLSASANC